MWPTNRRVERDALPLSLGAEADGWRMSDVWTHKPVCPRCGAQDDPQRDHWYDSDCTVVTCFGCKKNYERHVSVEIMFSCIPSEDEADDE